MPAAAVGGAVDGATLVPAALVDEIAAQALEQEALEAWIMDEVTRGVPLPGLYPPNAETRARYEAFREAQRQREREAGE
jgi:regulator of RNase E activity RraA